MDIISEMYDSGTSHGSFEFDDNTALADIEYFGIAPQVYFLLKQNGKLLQTPRAFQNSLKEAFDQTLLLNFFIKNQTVQIFSMFELEGIDVIPLKGTYFSETYFGHLGARPTSDIDLLIRETELEHAIACLKELGFSVEADIIPDHFHASFSKELPNSRIPLTVELHWDLIKKNTSAFVVEEFWQEANKFDNYQHVKELSVYHTFYMICLHGWRHNMDSLKYFIDIIQILVLHHDEIDYRTLLNDAKSHKTLKRMIRTLSIIYSQYPFLHKIKPFPYRKSILFWDSRAFRNQEKKSLKTYLDFFDYQLSSYDSPIHSLIEMKEWLHLLNPRKIIKKETT
ncbi:nucleotidyltransferase family protein [Bacillus sp. T3]|uniref:nucleotidyltransferase domain-containing protein n=1 Tax=Bacillus sp. T3 TaxID=467262 RepID=UPI002980A25D|nr:nucleotidyltransferase family protein [Bacillus sp. T3]